MKNAECLSNQRLKTKVRTSWPGESHEPREERGGSAEKADDSAPLIQRIRGKNKRKVGEGECYCALAEIKGC